MRLFRSYSSWLQIASFTVLYVLVVLNKNLIHALNTYAKNLVSNKNKRALRTRVGKPCTQIQVRKPYTQICSTLNTCNIQIFRLHQQVGITNTNSMHTNIFSFIFLTQLFLSPISRCHELHYQQPPLTRCISLSCVRPSLHAAPALSQKLPLLNRPR